MARAAAGAVAQAGTNEKPLFWLSVDITLPNFRRVIAEPILDLSPVARENLRNVTDRHSEMFAQANRVQPHLPGRSEVAGIYVVHLSCSENRAEGLSLSPGPHTSDRPRFDTVGGNKDFTLACRSPFNDSTIRPTRRRGVVRDDQKTGLFCRTCFRRCRRGGS